MAPITQYLVTELPQIFGTVNKRTSNNKSGEKEQIICEICVGKFIYLQRNKCFFFFLTLYAIQHQLTKQ